MFNFFRKNKKKELENPCTYDELLGYYYEEYRTTYRNEFDIISIYRRVACSCGKAQDQLIGTRRFKPRMYTFDNYERDEYVKELESKNILEKSMFIFNRDKIAR